MTNVAEFTHRSLSRSGFCICEIRPFGSLLQAWTTFDLEEVLDQKRHPHFLKPLYENAYPGDNIEIFQLPKEEVDKQDGVPLAMATVCVVSFETKRDGVLMRHAQTRPLLHFGSGAREGVSASRWNGETVVWNDGKRVRAFVTDIEANEHAARLCKAAGQLAPAPAQDARPATDLKFKARDEDLANSGTRRISNVIAVRTLYPIEAVLDDPKYFHRVHSRLHTGTRLSIIRFSDDRFADEPGAHVVEIIEDVIVDRDGPHVRLFPTSPIRRSSFEPETGLVLHTGEDGKQVLRRDGRVIERFKDEQTARWWLEERHLTPATAKVAA